MRKPGTIWTNHMIARFTELHADGTLSFDAIAAALNAEFGTELTRNAAIGKAHRLNLPMRFAPHISRSLTSSKAPTRMKKVKQMATTPLPPLPSCYPKPFTLVITDLERGDCRWPSGGPYERPPFFYCGEPSLEGLPYCKAHTTLSRASWRPA